MPDWRHLAREQLGRPRLPGEREAEVVDELAVLLEDASRAAGLDLEDEQAVGAWVREQGPWSQLAGELRAGAGRRRRPSRSREALPLAGRLPIAPEPQRRRGMTGWGTDLRSTLRSWRDNPLFPAVATLTLAVAIGLNSTAFSLVDAALLRPPPVRDPGSLVRVYSSQPDGFLPQEPMSYPDFASLGEGAPGLSATFAHALTRVAFEHGGNPELALGELASGGYFPALGLEPAAGRLFGEAEDRLGDPTAVVVLGHGFWRRRFGGDPAIVGQTVRVNGQPFTVAGVAPADFQGLLRGFDPQLWLPLTLGERLGATSLATFGEREREADLYHDRRRRWLWVGGRTAPGAEFEAVAAAIGSLGARLQADYPDTNEKRSFVTLPLVEVKVLPVFDQAIRLGSAVVSGVVGLVLLIACANLANLLLARALGRRREVATRLALGASRGRIARQLLLESLLLAAGGGAGGLALAAGAGALLGELNLGGIPLRLGLGLDGRVVAFTLAVSAAAALLCGMAPLVETGRTDLASGLREGERRGGSPRRRRLQSSLVAAQVAFSAILLVCGGLALRSVVHASRIDPGFEPESVAVLRLSLHLQGYDRPRATELYERLLREAAALPGVARVSQASHLPLSLEITTRGFSLETDAEEREVDVAIVGPGYFETLGIPILAGRGFADGDREDGPRVAVVNEALARQFWPGEPAVGKTVRSEEEEELTVVGVVATGKYRTLGEGPRPFAYVSFGQYPAGSRSLLVGYRPAMPPDLPALRRLVAAADPHLAISSLSPLAEVIRPASLLPRAGSALFGALGLLGLGLASVGLYGVLAYAVAQRTHEIGVRVALGAARRDILSLVLRQGLLLTAVAAGIGLGLASLVTGLLRSILYGISPHDPATFAAVGLAFLAVATAACLVPARRATAVDPMEALRSD